MNPQTLQFTEEAALARSDFESFRELQTVVKILSDPALGASNFANTTTPYTHTVPCSTLRFAQRGLSTTHFALSLSQIYHNKQNNSTHTSSPQQPDTKIQSAVKAIFSFSTQSVHGSCLSVSTRQIKEPKEPLTSSEGSRRHDLRRRDRPRRDHAAVVVAIATLRSRRGRRRGRRRGADLRDVDAL